MLFDGFALAILTTTGWVMFYQKLPNNIKRWLIKYDIFTDVGVLVLSYFLLGGGLTAMFASAIVDILTSAILHIAKHPDDYEFVFDAFKYVQKSIDQFKNYLKELNNSYKNSKVQEISAG